jgi:hypothetical protein
MTKLIKDRWGRVDVTHVERRFPGDRDAFRVRIEQKTTGGLCFTQVELPVARLRRILYAAEALITERVKDE